MVTLANDPLLKENMMSWKVIEGQWLHYKNQVMAQWGKLSNDNFDSIAGSRDQLVKKIQEAYGVDGDEAERQVLSFQKYLKGSHFV
jgi:uncharacterized protein YjbJ (UPF0337 family)